MPWRVQADIPEKTLRNVVEALEIGPEEYEKKWNTNIGILMNRASQYKEKEDQARKGLPTYVQRVSDKKRTKFMEDLLRQTKYPDTDVARNVREGFPLAGQMPTTGIFRKKAEEEVEQGAHPNGSSSWPPN